MLTDLLERLRALFHREAVETEMDEELRFHFESQVQELVARGMSRQEALRQTRLMFGGLEQVKEEYRDSLGVAQLDALWRDVRYAVRLFGRSPGFTAVAVLTLALGIGANTAIFTLLHAVLSHSPAMATADEPTLVSISLASPGHTEGEREGWKIFEALGRQTDVFSGVSAWQECPIEFARRGTFPRLYYGSAVSAGAFQLLGVEPLLGRMLAPSDGSAGDTARPWPVVLSYSFWQESFQGDRGVLSLPVTLSGADAVIVGVAPNRFEGVLPGALPKLYVPMEFLAAAGRSQLLDRGSDIAIIGRLRPGASLATASAAVNRFRRATLGVTSQPEIAELGPRVQADPHDSSWLRSVYLRPLLILQGLVGIVLLLCCINVAGLLLARASARAHEFAVRAAVGADRSQLLRQYLTESLLLALAGAVPGALVAWGASPLAARLLTQPGRPPLGANPDGTVLLVTAALAVFSTLLCGTIPALAAGRWAAARHALRAPARASSRATGPARAFVPLQLALSLLLVVTAGFLAHTLLLLRAQHPGFTPGGLLIERTRFDRLPQKGDDLVDLYQDVARRLEVSPGIESAAIAWFTPLAGGEPTAAFAAVGSGAAREDSGLAYNVVGPNYFRTMQTRLLAGREFSISDRGANVCILSHSAADFFFPGGIAIGQYVRATDSRKSPAPWVWRVIGVAGDAKYASLREPSPRTVYLLVNRNSTDLAALVFLVRARSQSAAISAFRSALGEVAPDAPVFAPLPLDAASFIRFSMPVRCRVAKQLFDTEE